MKKAGRKVFQQAPAGIEALKTKILAAFEQFTHGKAQTDDITFLLIQETG